MKRNVDATLTRKAAEYFVGEERTQLEYVAHFQANGGRLKDLAQDCGCSPAYLREYLRVRYGASEVREALGRAREEAAHVLAEESIELADGATKDTAIAAGLQVRSRQWLAERWNRADFGNDRQVGVQINLGTLMLAALQQPPPPRPTAIDAAIVEYAEVLSVDDATTSSVEQRITNPAIAATSTGGDPEP